LTLPTAACLSLTRGVSTPARSQPPSLRKCCTPTYSPAFPGANFSRHAAIPQHPNHIQLRVQIYLDKYGTFVVTSLLIVSRQPRRSVPISTTPLPHYPSTLLSCNSFPHNLLSDPHPLNPVASIFYKNIWGRGVMSNFPISSFKPLTPAFATDPQNAPITPFFATHPKSPSSKPFVCHTSDTPRGVVGVMVNQESDADSCPAKAAAAAEHRPVPTTSGRFRPCPKISAFRENAAFLFRLSGLPASRLFWRSRSSQAIMSPAIPSRIKSDAPCMA